MARVLLGPVLRCLLMGTHMLVRRSPGTCSMTRPLFLFPCGGFSLPSFRLLSGPVFLWSPSVSGEACFCLHRPGGWVRWGVLGGALLWVTWSAVF